MKYSILPTLVASTIIGFCTWGNQVAAQTVTPSQVQVSAKKIKELLSNEAKLTAYLKNFSPTEMSQAIKGLTENSVVKGMDADTQKSILRQISVTVNKILSTKSEKEVRVYVTNIKTNCSLLTSGSSGNKITPVQDAETKITEISISNPEVTEESISLSDNESALEEIVQANTKEDRDLITDQDAVEIAIEEGEDITPISGKASK